MGARTTLWSAALLGGGGFGLMAVLHTASWQIIVGALAVNTAVIDPFTAKTVSPDGRVLTITDKGTNRRGRPFSQTLVFPRP